MSDKIPIVTRKVVDVTDPEYFCNKSWTLSYNINTKSWVSFHSYIPNFYIAENNFFYSGLNSCCDDSLSLDVISTVVLPPSPTTTTSSTSSSSTTSTTTKAPDCDLEGTISIVDCTLVGIAINDGITCNCYIVKNITENVQTFSYMQCDGTPVVDQPILADNDAYICAKTGTVVVNGDFFNVSGPLGDCTTDGQCTTTSTTSNTTTLCPNCKTYTLENTTSSPKTITNIVGCDTGTIFSVSIRANTLRHICSCNPPTVPTGVTSTEFGSGCTKCFCYTVTNIEGIENYITYVDCSGNVVTNEPVPAYSSIYVCAQEATIVSSSQGVSSTGGTTSCSTNLDCNCWDC